MIAVNVALNPLARTDQRRTMTYRYFSDKISSQFQVELIHWSILVVLCNVGSLDEYVTARTEVGISPAGHKTTAIRSTTSHICLSVVSNYWNLWPRKFISGMQVHLQQIKVIGQGQGHRSKKRVCVSCSRVVSVVSLRLTGNLAVISSSNSKYSKS